MSEPLYVDLAHLDQIVSRLAGLSGFLEDHLGELDTKVQGLLTGSWNSAAAQAYADAHREWIAGAKEFTEGVKDMSDAAKRAHAGYTRASEVNSTMLRGG